LTKFYKNLNTPLLSIEQLIFSYTWCQTDNNQTLLRVHQLALINIPSLPFLDNYPFWTIYIFFESVDKGVCWWSFYPFSDNW